MSGSSEARVQGAIAAARERAQRTGEPCPSDSMVRAIVDAYEPVGIVAALGHIAAGSMSEINAAAMKRAIDSFRSTHRTLSAVGLNPASAEEIVADSGLLGATQVGIHSGVWACLDVLAKACTAPAAELVREGE